jgi:hypothetical protein
VVKVISSFQILLQSRHVRLLLAFLAGLSFVRVAHAAPDYFMASYDEARTVLVSHFQRTAAQDASVEVGSIPVPSDSDKDLTIDWCYLPAKGSPEKLLILTSAVHGVEGFAGSAVQNLFFTEILPKVDRTHLSILVVHAINPWGYRHLRRVDEHNVDLCRNWDTSEDLFKSANLGYDRLASFLNPRWIVSSVQLNEIFRGARLLALAAYHGMGVVRQAILQGQYRYPAGLYFGGQSFSAQKRAVEPLLKKVCAPHKVVLLVDLHTGYGNPGQLHYYPSEIRDPRAQTLLKKLFANYPIDSASENSSFYRISGDFGEYVAKIQAPDAVCVPMTFEYGTIGNLSIRGSLRSVNTMIVENQGHHHGYGNDQSKARIQKLFRELYIPSSPDWRGAVIQQARDVLPIVLERMKALGADGR